jgi:hypothetical protein
MNLDITPEGEDVPEAELQTSTVSGFANSSKIVPYGDDLHGGV